MGLLVHGVVPADAASALPAPALAEAAGGAVRCVVRGPLAGVVSEVSDAEVLPSRANLLAHMRVLETVSATATVLPMRFGVIVPDETALADEYLAARQESLSATLERLRGFVELRVRARYDEEEVIRSVVAGDATATRLRGKTDMASKMQLGERVAQGIDARRTADAERLVTALAPYAADVATTDTAAALDVVAASFLVAADDMDAFDDAVAEAGVSFAPLLRVELVGPLPPFSFTEGD